MLTKYTTIASFLLVFLGLSLASLMPIGAYAQSAPNLSGESINVTGSHNANVSVFVNPNGSTTELQVKYWTGSKTYPIKYYFGITSQSRIDVGLLNLIEGTNYSYQILARNSYGSTSGSIGSFTTFGGGSSSGGGTGTSGSGNNSGSSSGSGGSSTPLAPSVATNGPSSVSANSAVINGSVNANNVYTNFWFDFGTSPSLGQRTSIQPAGANNTWQLVTGNLSGLTSGTVYYYRVVAQNNLGTSFGEIKSFVATNSGTSSSSGSGGQVLGAVSGSGSGSQSSTNTSGSTGKGSSSSGGSGSSSGSSTGSAGVSNSGSADQVNQRPSFISLEYSLADERALVVEANDIKPKPGEEFNYTVVYKNDGTSSFNETTLKVIIPVEADYISASIEPLRISGNIVEFNLGHVSPGSKGSIIIVSKVKETTKPGANMIFTSVLIYKDRLGVQLATTSYLTIMVGESDISSSASLLGFLSGSATIWLLIFGLIVMIALAVYKFVSLRKERKLEEEKEEDILGFKGVPPTFEPVNVNNQSFDRFR